MRPRDLGHTCILSAVLADRLKGDPEAPWAEWGRGKGLTQNSLAVLLGGGGGRGRGSRGGYGVQSTTVHPSPNVQGKGYKWAQFEELWAISAPRKKFSAGRGGIDRTNVQTRTNKGQLAKIDRTRRECPVRSIFAS